MHDIDDPKVPYDERPREYYFREEERTEFGVLRFDRRKDNPYRDYEAMVSKIMNDEDFRASLLSPESRHIWLRSWK